MHWLIKRSVSPPYSCGSSGVVVAYAHDDFVRDRAFIALLALVCRWCDWAGVSGVIGGCHGMIGGCHGMIGGCHMMIGRYHAMIIHYYRTISHYYWTISHYHTPIDATYTLPSRHRLLARPHLHLPSHLVLLLLAETPASVIGQPVLQLVLGPISELLVGGTQSPRDEQQGFVHRILFAKNAVAALPLLPTTPSRDERKLIIHLPLEVTEKELETARR